MITSRLPPSRFRGSVATSIHTDSFNCFVSTVRGLIFSRRWQTLIVNGDPGFDKHCKAFARFFYQRGLSETDVWMIHDALAATLSDLGESGMTLEEAMDSLLLNGPFSELFKRGTVEPPVYIA
jgi:hypothetical protein